MKKTITILFCALISVASYNVYAQTSGTFGDLAWSLSTTDSVLTVSGNSEMPDSARWQAYPWNFRDGADVRLSFVSVKIEEGVESIGSHAFRGMAGEDPVNSLRSVTFPASLTKIGEGAFRDARRLTSITIPATVTSMADSVFRGCVSLTTVNFNAKIPVPEYCFAFSGSRMAVTFGDGVPSIGRNAFLMASLSSVSIPSSVTLIEREAFAFCHHLASIEIPGSVKTIGIDAFQSMDPGLATLTLNEGLEVIEVGAFRGAKFASLVIPTTVTTIGDYAFVNVPITTPLNIPDNVVSIGEYAFRNTFVKSVVIGNSVETIGDYAFEYGQNGAHLNTLEIGSSVKTIGNAAFGYQSRLGIVTIRANTPPITEGEGKLAADVFVGIDIDNVMLIVNPVAFDAYQAAQVWKDFLVAISLSDGIGALRNEILDLKKELFDCQDGSDFLFEIVSEMFDKEITDLYDLEDAIQALLDELDDCKKGSSRTSGRLNDVLIQVHPNPAANEVRITNQWAQGDMVELFDAKGQRIFTQRGGEVGTMSELVINISSLQSGNYILRIGSRIAKIVKQ
jgi:hypothetical protein